MMDSKALITIMIVGFFTIIACGEDEKKEETTQSSEIVDIKTDSNFTYFDLDVESLKKIKSGQEHTMRVSDEKEYRLIVRQAKQNIPGVYAISANIENKETGLASIIIQNDRATGSIDLYKTNQSYHIKYDSLEASHYLVEIEREVRESRNGGLMEEPIDMDSVINEE